MYVAYIVGVQTVMQIYVCIRESGIFEKSMYVQWLWSTGFLKEVKQVSFAFSGKARHKFD